MNLAEQIAAGRAQIDSVRAEWDMALREDPQVWVFDGHQRLQHVLLDVGRAAVDEIENDTGTLEVLIDSDHPVADWIRDKDGRIARGEGELVHIEYRHAGGRVSGRVDLDRFRPADEGGRLLELVALGEFENLRIPCWSNPFLPAIFQFPRIFLLAGPAIWVLKTALFVNLLRINSSIWQIPDDPLNPMTWLDGLDMSTWDIVVKPTTLLQDLADGTVWTLFTSRFGTWTDRAQPTLEDGEFTVITTRWRAGDPEPWPGARIKDGALVVDIVDKSRHREGRAGGGTIFDGMTRTVREAVGDLIEDTETLLTGQPQGMSKWWNTMFTTAPGYPTVHISADHEGGPTVENRAPRGGIITMGGQSAPGVNEGISAGVQALGDLVTSNINVGGYGIGPQGGAIDTLLAPFYTDVVAAFISAKLVVRIARSGSSRYPELVMNLPGKAYTLSSALAFRQAVRATAGGQSVSAKFPAGGPWVIGPAGHGHAWIGDPVSFEVPDDPTGQVHVERISRVKTVWSPEDAPGRWDVTAGRGPDTDPFEVMADRVRHLAQTATDLGVWG